MKAFITTVSTVEAKTLEVEAKVRYWEDATINGQDDEDGTLVPCREGENWCPIIDIDSGKILNWTPGTEAEIHYKVCDCCVCRVKDAEGNILKETDGYVPGTLCPKESGYGDYIIMDVDADGMIRDWDPSMEDFDLL